MIPIPSYASGPGASFRDLLARARPQPAYGLSGPLRSQALGALSAPAPVTPRQPRASTYGYGSAPAPTPAPTASRSGAAFAPSAPAPPHAETYNQNNLTPEQQQAVDWTRHHGLGGLGSTLAQKMQNHYSGPNAAAQYNQLAQEAVGYNQAGIGDQTREAERAFEEEMAGRGLSGSGLETQGLATLHGQEGAGLGGAYLQGLRQRLGLLNQQSLMSQQFQNELALLKEQQSGSSPWGDILGAGLSFLPGSGAGSWLAKLLHHGGGGGDPYGNGL